MMFGGRCRGTELFSSRIGNDSVQILLAQCWFTGLAISNAEIYIYFSNKIYGSSFMKQHAETAMV